MTVVNIVGMQSKCKYKKINSESS